MTFQPELGQAVFGQPYKSHEVPEIWDAALCFLREELRRAMWNKYQKETDDPFGNSGAQFDCQTFSAHAYSWGDEDQPWNFKWRDVEISWYKYLGRGMSANKKLSPELASEMLIDCLNAIREIDEATMREMDL